MAPQAQARWEQDNKGDASSINPQAGFTLRGAGFSLPSGLVDPFFTQMHKRHNSLVEIALLATSADQPASAGPICHGLQPVVAMSRDSFISRLQPASPGL
jgi:hypothetical protein